MPDDDWSRKMTMLLGGRQLLFLSRLVLQVLISGQNVWCHEGPALLIVADPNSGLIP